MKCEFTVLTLVVVAGLGMHAAAQTAGQKPAGSDPAALARNIVTQCAAVGEGDKVLIAGGMRDAELLENLAIEVRKLGAFPFIEYQSEQLMRRYYADVPAKFDAQEPAFGMRLADMIDVAIDVDFMESMGLFADVPSERLIASQKAEMAVFDKLLKRGVRQVALGNGLYPTKARAAEFELPQDELARLFWAGVNVDYAKLQAIGAKVQGQLAGGSDVKITAPNGTDLTLKIGGQKVLVSDGVISAEDRKTGGAACQVWLPAGEVYVVPVAGSANGTFVVDHAFYEGKAIEGLKLEFKDGKLTAMSATGDVAALKKRYDEAPAGKEMFGFIDLGINPNVEAPKTGRFASWVATGTVSVGVGNNAWAGGDNKCPFDFYGNLNGVTLVVDGKPVVKDGKLMATE